MMEIDDNDSHIVIVIKITIIIVIMLVSGYSTLINGLKILKQRKKKIGFVR
jgi:hypothetical protein